MLRTDEQARYDWDVPLGRVWAKLLLVCYFLPIVFPLDLSRLGGARETIWIWPWTGLDERAFGATLLSSVPLLLAVSAWLLLFLRARRLRGALLLALCAAAVFIPAEHLLLANAPGGLVRLATTPGALLGALLLGLIFIAAGNRQQKRTLGRGPAPLLAGVGGLLVLGAFLYPSLSLGLAGEATAPAAVFLDAEAWKEAWIVLGWLGAVFVFGLLGAMSLFGERVNERLAVFLQRWISRLARLLPLTFPFVVLASLIESGAPGFLYIAFFVVKVTGMLYSILFLAAIGLARVLDDAQPEVIWMPDEAPGTDDAPEAQAA